jgi:hypothetical protein
MRKIKSYDEFSGYKEDTLLSIMLPTTVDRRDTFVKLLSEIKRQIQNLKSGSKVEIIIDEDNKEKSIGKKRQDLLERAKGKYVVGIDSDDWISKDYLSSIIEALEKNPEVDHVGFTQHCDLDGLEAKTIFSSRYKKWESNKDGYDYVRSPGHLSVIKRDKALKAGYDDARYGEDKMFSDRVTPLIKSEVMIPKDLYFYRYKSEDHNKKYGIKN